MSVESLPVFTPPARRRWESIPADVRQRLLANVWCAHCCREVRMTSFSGTIKNGGLLLVGQCAECHGDRSRIERGHDLALRHPLGRQRMVLEPQQAHAPRLQASDDGLHNRRLQQRQAQHFIDRRITAASRRPA